MRGIGDRYEAGQCQILKPLEVFEFHDFAVVDVRSFRIAKCVGFVSTYYGFIIFKLLIYSSIFNGGPYIQIYIYCFDSKSYLA